MKGRGYDALWLWFGLSYAGWLTLPRVLMHEMPDDWQQRMADLLAEFDQTFPGKNELPFSTQVSLKTGGRFVAAPDWLLRYRRPDLSAINALRK
jgi:hypothetical protein